MEREEEEGKREGEREEGEVQLLKVVVGKVVVVVEATRRNCTNEGTTRRQPGGSRTGIASCRTTSTLFLIDMWNNTRIDVRIEKKIKQFKKINKVI